MIHQRFPIALRTVCPILAFPNSLPGKFFFCRQTRREDLELAGSEGGTWQWQGQGQLYGFQTTPRLLYGLQVPTNSTMWTSAHTKTAL